jgi:predicted HTH transcriptional regulator
MQLEELLELLRAGALREHRQSNLELKESWTRDHGRKLSALANRLEDQPAWVFVGVTDDGRLVGRDEKWARTTEQIMSQQLNQYLDPSQACTRIGCHDLDGRWVIVLALENPGAVVKWEAAAYKAVGTTMQVMTPAEIMELTVRLPGLSDYSAQPWQGAISSQLVGAFADSLLRRRTDLGQHVPAAEDSATFLQEIGIGDTNTRRILFGDCAFRLVRYDHAERVIENVTLKGLFQLLTDGFLDDIQHWSADQSGVPVPVYPPRALREGLANAVAHAAYFEADGDVIIEAFADRLSISNLCVRESEYFANKWFSRSHKTINRLLMESLRLSGHVDELGLGKNVIFVESLRNGKRPPQVVLEGGHRYDRWRLLLYGGHSDDTQLRLLQRCRQAYPEERKALIANALVLWRDRPVAEIRKFVDGESLPLFADVLTDLNGPIYYYRKGDRIVLRRWAAVLLGEGKDSKQLSIPEEESLLALAYELRTKYHLGYVTPKELRELAGMGHTASEGVLISTILGKWKENGIVERVKKGLYRFVPRQAQGSERATVLDALREPPDHKGPR